MERPSAIDRLKSCGVREDRIMFVTVIAASQGIHALAMRYPQMKIITSEVDAGLNDDNRVVPGVGEFGDRYFGTEDHREKKSNWSPYDRVGVVNADP